MRDPVSTVRDRAQEVGDRRGDRQTPGRHPARCRHVQEDPVLPDEPEGWDELARRVLPGPARPIPQVRRSEEHTSELQSLTNLVCRLLLEKKKKEIYTQSHTKYHS